MKKITSILLSGTFILGVSGLAMANTPVIRGRLHEQQERIQQGVHSGELNRREATRLEEQQARIRTSLEYDKLHGGVTPAERGSDRRR